jgi:glucose/mannose-6-phosphate isomerase
VIGGMGGSAIAGEVAADLASLQKTVPICVVRDLHFPFALSRRSLVILCSYSGNTEETLSLFHHAVEASAQVIVVTGGGRLASKARVRGVPLLSIDIPGEPRSAAGASLMLLLGCLRRLGVIKIAEEDVQTAIDTLREQVARLSEEVPTSCNPAKQVALELKDKLIVIYGGGIFSGVARRWKTQLNENAKAWAFFETVPELLHNSVEAYAPSPKIAPPIRVLLLQPNDLPNPGKEQYHVVSQLLRRFGLSHRILEGENGSPLDQMLAMLLLGDYVSYYLAMLNGVDPSPTPAIALAKRPLSGGFP